MSQDISCIILAGGKSSRLERDKAFETIGNKTLLQRTVSVLESFNSDIILVTSKNDFFHSLNSPRLRTVTDIYPGKGVLGGLYTGLVTSNSFYNLVVGSDMPFLNRELLRYMIQRADGYDVVVPRLGTMCEPLHAIYSKNCVPHLEPLLKQNRLRIIYLYPSVRVRYIGEQEIDRFDPERLSLFNVNTKADLNKARKLIKRKTSDEK